jgi:hypothetical protein
VVSSTQRWPGVSGSAVLVPDGERSGYPEGPDVLPITSGRGAYDHGYVGGYPTGCPDMWA